VIYWLLDNTLAAACLALVALVLGRVCRRRPTVVHLAWCVVLVRLVLPPLPPFLDGRWIGGLFAAAATSTAPAASTQAAILSTAPESMLDGWMRWMTRTWGGGWSIWLTGGVVAVWAVGAGTSLLIEERRRRRARRLVAVGESAERDVGDLVRSIAARLSLRAPRVRVVQGIPGPFVWAARRPVLVLPKARDARWLATDVAHELSHLARRDHVVAWLELVAGLVHWWNPLFWVARFHLHRTAELACDAWVLRLLPERRLAYAESLLDTAEHVQRTGARRPIGAVGMAGGDLRRRMEGILRGRPEAPLRPGALQLAVALPLLLAPAWFLAPAEELIPDYPAGASVDGYLLSLGVSSWDEALAAAAAELERDPDSPAAMNRFGLAQIGLGRYEDAVRTFERAVDLHPDVRALYNAGCAHALAGDFDAAFAWLDEAHRGGADVVAMVVADPDFEALRRGDLWDDWSARTRAEHLARPAR